MVCVLYLIQLIIVCLKIRLIYFCSFAIILDKKPMGQIAHLRKQFKSINTYYFIITLIRRRKNLLSFFWEWNDSLFEETWIPFMQWYFAPSLFEIGLLFLRIWLKYFYYFVIISPLKRTKPFVWTKLNPFIQRCFMPSLVEIGPVLFENFFLIQGISLFRKHLP